MRARALENRNSLPPWSSSPSPARSRASIGSKHLAELAKQAELATRRRAQQRHRRRQHALPATNSRTSTPSASSPKTFPPTPRPKKCAASSRSATRATRPRANWPAPSPMWRAPTPARPPHSAPIASGLEPVLEFRRDRFLRGGDHTSFNQQGFAAVRFTEWREDFNHQHQNVRVEERRPVRRSAEVRRFRLRRARGAPQRGHHGRSGQRATGAGERAVSAAGAGIRQLHQQHRPSTGRAEPARPQAQITRSSGARQPLPTGSAIAADSRCRCQRAGLPDNQDQGATHSVTAHLQRQRHLRHPRRDAVHRCPVSKDNVHLSACCRGAGWDSTNRGLLPRPAAVPLLPAARCPLTRLVFPNETIFPCLDFPVECSAFPDFRGFTRTPGAVEPRGLFRPADSRPFANGFAAELSHSGPRAGAVLHHGWIWQLGTYCLIHQGILGTAFELPPVVPRQLSGVEPWRALAGGNLLCLRARRGLAAVGHAAAIPGRRSCSTAATAASSACSSPLACSTREHGIHDVPAAVHDQGEISGRGLHAHRAGHAVFCRAGVCVFPAGRRALRASSTSNLRRAADSPLPAASSLFGLRNRYYRWKRRRAAKKFEVYMRKHRDN